MYMRWDRILFLRLTWAMGLLLLLTLSQLSSCVSDQQAATTPDQLPEPEPLDSLDIPIDRVAICVYEKVGLRREPGNKKTTKERENNYILTIRYGEKVEIIPDSSEVESGGRNYMYVKLLDGQEGWVHDYVFEKHGRLAVMTDYAELHRRPDLMTLRDDLFRPGEIVVVIENPENPGQYGEWLHVSYRDKKKKGWIQRKNNLSFAKRDVQVALLYYKARLTRNPQLRLERLQEVISRDVSQESVVRSFILDEITELKSETDPNFVPDQLEASSPEDKLFITVADTWLQSEPIAQASRGISQLQPGSVCIIIDRGDQMTIDDMNDYWYHVRFEDMEGWVYGYFTSKRVLE